jgi:hypothetical protein
MRENHIDAMKLLREAVLNLSRPAVDQIAYLEQLKRGRFPAAELVDELALEFSDSFLATRWRFKSFSVQREFERLCYEISQLLDQMSDQKADELWTYNGLRTLPEWENLRQLARRCFDQFPEIGS